MKKIITIFILTLFVVTLASCNKQASKIQTDNTIEKKQTVASEKNIDDNIYSTPNAEQVAEKLEVYYFHRATRCYSCKIIGQYVKETMDQKYGEQIKNGTIDFKELNVELPENKEITQKFQASGSSLYINKIIDGKDNIEQDTNVWRLLGDETKFKNYLENKINSYLGL